MCEYDLATGKRVDSRKAPPAWFTGSQDGWRTWRDEKGAVHAVKDGTGHGARHVRLTVRPPTASRPPSRRSRFPTPGRGLPAYRGDPLRRRSGISRTQESQMPEAVIVATARSPIGRAFKGSLKDLRPDDLAATIVRAALDKVPAARPDATSTT